MYKTELNIKAPREKKIIGYHNPITGKTYVELNSTLVLVIRNANLNSNFTNGQIFKTFQFYTISPVYAGHSVVDKIRIYECAFKLADCTPIYEGEFRFTMEIIA